MAEPIISPPRDLAPQSRSGEISETLATKIPARFHRWASIAIDLGFHDFVTADDGFKSTLQDDKKWSNANATGVYFWVAENGEMYVGKATRVKSRLLSHWKNHPDLSYASFQIVPADVLDRTEQDLIKRVCDHGYPTRNIKHALETNVQVPFDHFVDAEQKQKFLSSNNVQNFFWRELPSLEQKQGKKFSRLLGETHVQDILATVRCYVERVIPAAALTEARFWSISLYTQIHVVRINVGQQEVFTLTMGRDDNLYARALTQREFGPNAEGPIYQTQCYDAWMPAQGLGSWLTGERLQASRELVVWLMRHTTTLNSGSHCPQVVRAAFD